MKRFAVAILAVIYFSISSGVVMNLHYCMGKVSSAQLSVLPSKNCLCGKSQTAGCCKTEYKLVKLTDAQKAAYTDYAFHTPIVALCTGLNLLHTPFYNAQNFQHTADHSPPLLSEQDTYLQNGVFRI